MSFPVPYEQYLDKVIVGGIAEMQANTDRFFNTRRQEQEGGIAGFEACRGKLPEQLLTLLDEAGERRHKALREEADDYWYHRGFEQQVEWTLNCVASLYWMFNRPFPRESPLWPTARGTRRAVTILSAMCMDDTITAPRD